MSLFHRLAAFPLAVLATNWLLVVTATGITDDDTSLVQVDLQKMDRSDSLEPPDSAQTHHKAPSAETQRMVGLAKKYLGLRMEQVVTRKAHSSGDEAVSAISSFTSDDGHFCAEGSPRAAEGMLALKKAGVQGALFRGSFTTLGKSCQQRGFALLGGADSCHLGLTTYFKDKPGYQKFMKAEDMAFVEFRENNQLSEVPANLIAACNCHPDSTIMAHAAGKCASIAHEIGAWVHADPQTGNGLVCLEGALKEATFSLAALKSTASLPMHLNDSVVVNNCASLGFPMQHSQNDHCFPKMSVWTRESDNDQGIKEFQAVQERLLSGGFKSWAQGKGMNLAVLDSVPGCHCPADSEVAQNLGGICTDPDARSPIRDWAWTAPAN